MMNERKAKIDEKSILWLADSLVKKTRQLFVQVRTEEDLRIGFEKILEPIKKELGIELTARYEKSVYTGRSDAVHGQLIIEYESPGSFSSKRNIEHTYDQLVNYLLGESGNANITQLVGVGFDGKQIFFVRYYGKGNEPIDKEKFAILGPYHFTPESARTFLIHLRALSRIPLTPENLAAKFGSQSELATLAVSSFVNSLEYWGNQTRVRVFFNEWKRLFGIVYGNQFSGYPEEAKELAGFYKVNKEIDFQELLFSIHTYFALLMKLIAAEILTLRETALSSSLAFELAHSSEEDLKRRLEEIENGGIYAQRGISNFLEGDFFRWYLEAWSPSLKDTLQEITMTLSEFEPATSTLNPSATRDLLKKLYQYLVPRKIRHHLGEYYTPDWLAELVLNEVKYDGNNFKRVLDPACGSGTFLVLAIQRAKEWGLKNKRPPLEIAKSIVANIWGFDLNPLAVIAARTNYLFALGDLVNELLHIEIPVYLTDSVLTPTKIKGDMFGNFLEVATSVGEFQIPAEWVRDKGFLMSRAAPLIEEMVKNQYFVEEAMERLRKEGLVFKYNQEVVKNFYKRVLDLEKQNKNGIWARFLKNTFAPMTAGKFDFVVGNPPWIRWGYLSREYRQATLNMWKKYGLFSLKGHAARLGGGEKDFSMLFTYAAADHYLKKGAKLGFLITQEVFKSKGAGEGFRRFRIGDREYLKVLKAHDLVTIQPFEGASNKTALIILKKGEKTIYPLPYILWEKKKEAGKIRTDDLIEEVLRKVKRVRLIAQPIDSEVGPWQTFHKATKKLINIGGKNVYTAYRGASTEPYGVFWLEVRQVLSDGNLLVRNLSERGRKKLKEVEIVIEPDLVFPAVSGADIKRWKATPLVYVLIVQDPNTRAGYTEPLMKEKWPHTYAYLLNFRKELEERASYKKYHAPSGNPFYSQYNIAYYSFANYKVIWKRMANDIVAAVVNQHRTPFGYKVIIPTDTTSFFATHNEVEAHYLCAVINSKLVRDFIKSFSSAGRGFGTPSVMQYVGIPKFDPDNKLHQKLAEISQKSHQFKLEGKEEEVKQLERKNEKLVKMLFGI